MNAIINEKFLSLKKYIRDLKGAAVAFSGGADSTLLLKIAQNELNENLAAITARSVAFPRREMDEAAEFTSQNGIKHIILDFNPFIIDEIKNNPADRCYHCKKRLFALIKKTANQNGLKFVLDGTNYDDINTYRPGLKAAQELDIKSPLKDLMLTKAEIRMLSKELGIKTWQKPSFSCLLSRLPYGESITEEKIKIISKAEQFLFDLGFEQVRVRHHKEIARIEVYESDFYKIMDKDIKNMIVSKFKNLGYKYVTVDLGGYRSGSMDENLNY